MLVSVVIPAHDAAGTLGRTLDALSRQELAGGFEVIVVDDGSADGTAAIASAHPIGATVLAAGGVGAAGARNLGAAHARAEILAFTDADCEPLPRWLAEGLRACDAADLVQGAVSPRPDVRRGPFDRTLEVSEERGLYESANLFVRRELFERLGGFRGWIPRDGGRPLGEDVDFGWRARRSGAVTAFSESALVHHAVFPRGAVAFVAEHFRRGHFPAIASRCPELRTVFLYRRYFLDARTASFDLALAAVALGAALRTPLPLVAALPYCVTVARQSLWWGRVHAPATAAVGVVADVVTFAALVSGSVRARALVL
jgi:glycosyltransferase involved in cell wall biosynthesis